MNKFIPLFLDGGWVVLLIGGAGMIARIVTSKNQDDKTLTQILSNISSAMITSLIAWFILEQFKVDAMYKAIAYGLVGLNSPELLSGIIKISSSFATNPLDFINNIRSSSSSSTSAKKPTPKQKQKKKI
jgi:predicted MFS family arabinose efflux permease